MYRGKSDERDVNIMGSMKEIRPMGPEANSNYKVLEEEAKPVYRLVYNKWILVALMSLLYIFLGSVLDVWDTAWVIIPVTAILLSPIKTNHKIVAITPLFYVFVGLFLEGLWFLPFSGVFHFLAEKWWGIAWIIIPVNAIIFECVKVVKEEPEKDI
jgi:hypothetical protein